MRRRSTFFSFLLLFLSTASTLTPDTTPATAPEEVATLTAPSPEDSNEIIADDSPDSSDEIANEIPADEEIDSQNLLPAANKEETEETSDSLDDLAALEAQLAAFEEPTEDNADTGVEEGLQADEEDFEDLGPESEPGSYNPKSGAQLTLIGLGTWTFAPSPEAVTAGTMDAQGKKNLAASSPGSLSLGQKSGAVLAHPRMHVKENGHLFLEADFTVREHTGKARLKSSLDGELIFDITFPKKFSIPITPEKVVETNTFNLSILVDKSGPPLIELYTEQSVFTTEKEMRLTFDITGEGFSEAVAEELPLPLLVPSAHDNQDLKQIMLEELVFTIYNPFDSTPPMAEITVECTARLDHIKIWGDVSMGVATCEITLSQHEVELIAEGNEPIRFDDDAILERPSLEVVVEKDGSIEIFIRGIMACKLPLLGTMRLPMEGEKREDGVKLLARLEKGVGFGPVKFKNPQLMFYSTDGTSSYGTENNSDARVVTHENTHRKKIKKVEVQGTAKLFGLELTPIIRFITPDTGGKRQVEFSGKFKAPNLNPIKQIPGLNKIPALKDFMLKQAEVGMDAAKSLFVSGTSTLFGISGIAKVAKGKKGFLVDIGTQKPWRISDTIPKLKGSFFDSIVFSSVRFAQSTYAGFDHATNMPLKKGLNIFGTLDTSQGVFQNLRQMCGGALPQSVTATISVSPRPRFSIILPFDIKLSSKASLHSLVFEVSMETTGPSIALMVILRFTPSSKDPPLLFTARIEFEIIGCALSATMEGFWHHPFGIKGFHVGDLAVEVKLPYAIPPIPIAFGMTGMVQIGDFFSRVAVKLGADDTILLGELSKFPVFGFVEILKQMNIDLGPADVIKAIDMYFEKLKFKFAPTGGQIGTIMFEPGISGHGELACKIPGIIDTRAIAGFNVSVMGGLKLYAQMPNLELGPLKISGKGQDREYGTEDDGPILRAILSFLEQRIFMSAKAEILGLETEAEVDIKLTAIRFKMLLKLLSFLKTQMYGESYLEGRELGFRIAALAKLGEAKLKLLGDLSYFGFEMGANLESLTLADLASIANIPTDAVPNIGFKDCEFYLKFKPGEQALDLAIKGTTIATNAVADAATAAAGAISDAALVVGKEVGKAAVVVGKKVGSAALHVAGKAGKAVAKEAIKQLELEDEIEATRKAFESLEKTADELVATGQAIKNELTTPVDLHTADAPSVAEILAMPTEENEVDEDITAEVSEKPADEAGTIENTSPETALEKMAVIEELPLPELDHDEPVTQETTPDTTAAEKLVADVLAKAATQAPVEDGAADRKEAELDQLSATAISAGDEATSLETQATAYEATA